MTQVEPVPAARLAPGDFIASCAPEDLIYFLLNVGDGDTQLILLPSDPDGRRRALVVDVAGHRKLGALLEALAESPLLAERRGLFAVVVATHPHDDHIGGMATFLDRFHRRVSEFWEPGYYHPTPTYIEMMRAVEDHQLVHSQPAAGLRRYIGQVRLTVLGPSVGMRNRFDTYGVDINNSSLALKLDFPASRVEQTPKGRAYVQPARRQSLILGADAQTEAWGAVMADFPRLLPDRSDIARALSKRRGADLLRAQVFKVPHHGSKHGLSLELVEAISPRYSLVSSVSGKGKYNFPHSVTLEALREGLEATAASGKPHRPDHELGIHYTAARDTGGVELGSVALVYPPKGAGPSLWRLCDGPRDDIDLRRARLYS